MIDENKKEIVAYFPEWGVEHQPYYLKHIEEAGSADKFTIMNYAFGVPTPDSTGKVVVLPMSAYYAYEQLYTADMSVDGIADDSTQVLHGQFNQLKKLKSRHPQMRVVVSLGGWLGSVHFSDAALTPESREIFVDSAINLFIKGNIPVEKGEGAAAGIFDGIDIDWEFPVSDGPPGIKHNENDRENLTELFKLFRNELDKIDANLLLTAAVPAREHQLDNFNLREDQKYLDWILIMSYDFVGSWDTQSGHHTNLYSAEKDSNYFGAESSLDSSVKLLKEKYGVVANKIIPGVAFYGRGWKITFPANNGLFELGTAAPGIYEDGFDYYRDLIPLIGKNYKAYWDDKVNAPYLFSKQDSIFWTYDNLRSIKLKTNYVLDNDLRGIMFWEITGDDEKGTLVNTIHEIINSQ